MVSVGSLTEEQRQVLRRLRRRAVGRVAERAQMVLLSARGYPVADIAEIFALLPLQPVLISGNGVPFGAGSEAPIASGRSVPVTPVPGTVAR